MRGLPLVPGRKVLVPGRKVRETGSPKSKAGPILINLQQDAEGFIRMNRHFPGSTLISIRFNDGSSEEFFGRQLNKVYDEALAAYRAGNHLDAKGYSRAPKKAANPGNKIEFVAVHPGMAT